MEITIKLLILILVDLAALIYILFRLMNNGNSFSQALQVVWELVVFKSGATDSRVFAKTDGLLIFKSVWWFTNFLCLTVWVMTKGVLLSCIILFLFLLHAYGYYHYKKESRTLERFVYLNANWGMIYLAVGDDSFLKGKSLSELDLRKKNLLVLAVERGGQVTAFPKGIEVLGKGDRIVVFGDLNSYRSLEV